MGIHSTDNDLLGGIHPLKGRLVDAGKPASGWRVQLHLATDWSERDTWYRDHPEWSTQTDKQGRFALIQTSVSPETLLEAIEAALAE